MTQTVFELLTAAALAAPDNVAIHYGNDTLSWRELEGAARRAAAGFSSLGIREGDRIAFWLPNTPAYLIAYFASTQLGAIAVAVNTRYRAKEVADIVSRSGAKTMILWPNFRGIDFLTILEEIPPTALERLETLILYSEGPQQPDVPRLIQGKPVRSWEELTDMAPYMYDKGTPIHGCNMFTTSGTTSAPKFVLHNQRSIVAHANELWSNMATLVGDGALLQTLPFCGVFGFTSIILAVAGHKPMIISSTFDAAETVRLVDEHKISYFSATDDMVMAMLAADPRPMAMPGLTAIGFGAFNASPEELAERAAARGVCLVGLYGMSEVMALYARRSADDPPEARIQGGGKLISPDAEVRVREPDSGILCAHGEKGELEIRGPSLMTGYFENEAATSTAFTEDGFLKTGDLGFTTSQSEFTYVTRMGDTLRLGGFLVSPVEIEAHLAEHETVAGAQVVSVRVGDAIRAYAFIVGARRQEVSTMTLDSHCRASLASFKVPIAFHVLDAFPKTKGANGTKIQRARLREIAQTAVDRGGNQ